MPLLQYSPKLRAALEEIKAVCKKHDIAGAFVLHEPGFAEYGLAFEPSYSLCKLISNGYKIEITPETCAGDKMKLNKAVAQTANMVMMMHTLLEHATVQVGMMNAAIIEKFEITHTRPHLSRPEEQQN